MAYTRPIPVSFTDPSVKQVVQHAYPQYKGRKVLVHISDDPVDVTSYWSEGNRSYFVVMDLRTFRTMGVPQNGTPFDGGPIRPGGVVVPVGFAIVEHERNGRSTDRIVIHVHPSTVAPWLPAPLGV